MSVPPPVAAPAERPPAAPPSPARSFAWAAAWAVVAALGFVVLALNWQATLSSDLYGQRTVGIVLFTPIIAVVLAGALLARGIATLGRARRYRERYPAAQRERFERERLAGQPSTPFIVFACALAAIWLAGSVVVLVFLPQLLERTSGLSLALMLLTLLAMAWVSVLQAGLRRRRAAAGDRPPDQEG